MLALCGSSPAGCQHSPSTLSSVPSSNHVPARSPCSLPAPSSNFVTASDVSTSSKLSFRHVSRLPADLLMPLRHSGKDIECQDLSKGLRAFSHLHSPSKHFMEMSSEHNGGGCLAGWVWPCNRRSMVLQHPHCRSALCPQDIKI